MVYQNHLIFKKCSNNFHIVFPFFPGFKNIHYSPDYKDQAWIVNCCPIAETLVDCKNSGFVNNFYKDVNFDIPQGYYLHGVESVHDFNHQRQYARYRVVNTCVLHTVQYNRQCNAMQCNATIYRGTLTYNTTYKVTYYV